MIMITVACVCALFFCEDGLLIVTRDVVTQRITINDAATCRETSSSSFLLNSSITISNPSSILSSMIRTSYELIVTTNKHALNDRLVK